MRIPVPDIEPVAIALDQIEASGDVRFSGLDLESGARVTVLIERAAPNPNDERPKREAQGLVLVLTMETIVSR